MVPNRIGHDFIISGQGQVEGLPKMGDRFIDPSAARQRQAEVVVGIDVIGHAFQGLLVMRHRLVGVPENS